MKKFVYVLYGEGETFKKVKKVRKTWIKVFQSMTFATLSIRKQKTASKSVKKREFYVKEVLGQMRSPIWDSLIFRC